MTKQTVRYGSWLPDSSTELGKVFEHILSHLAELEHPLQVDHLSINIYRKRPEESNDSNLLAWIAAWEPPVT